MMWPAKPRWAARTLGPDPTWPLSCDLEPVSPSFRLSFPICDAWTVQGPAWPQGHHLGLRCGPAPRHQGDVKVTKEHQGHQTSRYYLVLRVTGWFDFRGAISAFTGGASNLGPYSGHQ